jgi:hypothetical protein
MGFGFWAPGRVYKAEGLSSRGYVLGPRGVSLLV